MVLPAGEGLLVAAYLDAGETRQAASLLKLVLLNKNGRAFGAPKFREEQIQSNRVQQDKLNLNGQSPPIALTDEKYRR